MRACLIAIEIFYNPDYPIAPHFILLSAAVMLEIRPYETSMDVFILADSFLSDIDVLTVICIVKFVQISVARIMRLLNLC